jgi:uncharacterized protein YjiK
MRVRHLLALATAALAVATAVPTHAAGIATLDGKKVRKIVRTASGGLQANDADTASIDDVNRADCAMPRCYRLDFVYQPAPGVKGNVLFKITWTNPASDYDLYVTTDKRGQLAHCGGPGGLGEQLVLSGKSLKPGKRYSLVADFFRSVNDKVTATVEFPTATAAGTAVPAAADTIFPANCVIDANT